jgi:glycosyltransferase involved in cell wall biosynthesis
MISPGDNREREATPSKIGGVLWVDRQCISGTYRQIVQWGEHHPNDAVFVVGLSELRESVPDSTRFTSVEELLSGRLHLQAVRPNDLFGVAKILIARLGLPGTDAAVFVSPGIALRGPLTEFFEKVQANDAVLSFVPSPRDGSAVSHTRELFQNSGYFSDEVLGVRFGSKTLQSIADDIVVNAAATHATPFSTLWNSALTQHFFASTGEPKVAVSSNTVVAWHTYCRWQGGGPVSGDLPAVSTSELRAWDRAASHLSEDQQKLEKLRRLASRSVSDLAPVEAWTDSPVATDVNREDLDNLIADIRRSSDPGGRRWTDSSGEDFLAWLSEGGAGGSTRLSCLLEVAGISNSGAPVLAQPTAFDARKPATWTRILPATGDERDPRFGSKLQHRIELRRAAVAPDLDLLGNASRSIVRSLLPFGVRSRISESRESRSRKSGPSFTGGTFGNRRLVGLNIIGQCRNDNGLSVVMANNVQALAENGVHFSLWDSSELVPANRAPASNFVPPDATGDVNLLHLNINEIEGARHSDLKYALGGRFNIGYWFWETSTISPHFSRSVSLLQEAWCATSFLSEVMENHGVPSKTVGMAYALPQPDLSVSRGNAPFTILYAFDCNSSLERKNPFGLVDAFERACGSNPDVRLVLKANNAGRYPKTLQMLQNRSSEIPNVVLLVDFYSRTSLNALIQAADLYVSPHRSEGVGLTLLESMALGTPCVASGYSGNLDFMDEECAWLLPGRPTKSERADGPYPAGTSWFDPDIDYLTDVLRAATSGELDLAGRSQKAKARAAAFCNPQRYSDAMKAQLTRIGLQVPSHIDRPARELDVSHVDVTGSVEDT